ncbi:hypothetical protein [Sporosarcina aquimarina]|uniref:DUF4179 domain-containing protein n=1 Tax=Sporosarcina aquimarina TaxID=114975 RepID=A0ABU4FZS4_9BACL|nr:hypothetical protein [Sporosarcina aquimarina]MDW0110218.1 hypothetical protein [Sporosarcina aquimarina]
MKHLSDSEINQELKSLNMAVQPSSEQKREAEITIFQQASVKSAARPSKWIPIFVSLLLFISFAAGSYVLISPSLTGSPADTASSEDSLNVTESWKNSYLRQTRNTDNSLFVLITTEHSLTIINEMESATTEIDEKVEDGFAEKNKSVSTLPEPSLPTGEFDNFKMEKNGDQYTLQVNGDNGFTYHFTRIDPRKYEGEEGVIYDTSLFIEDEVE